MANSNGWGDGAANNNIGWGQGATNAIGWGSVYAVSSAGRTDIIGATAPVNTVLPVVSGYSYIGDLLTTTDGTWTGTPTSFSYQWKRGVTNIGTNANTYTLVSADAGTNITCVVTATNATGSTPATSNVVTAAVLAAPTIIDLPYLTPPNPLDPFFYVGDTISIGGNNWDSNPPNPTLTYQWLRNGGNITGETSATYLTVIADYLQDISVKCIATNSQGTAFEISNAITPTAVFTPFAFTANTNNTSTGSSTATQFKLPLTTSTGLNIVVDWGDFTTSTITNHLDAAVTHTYASAGTYSISITGTLPGWQFNNTGDRLKILNISSYGVLDITTNSIFRGCTNLISNATDAPTITTTDLSFTFRDCTNFNNNVGSWNVSAVTIMTSMFNGASAFNNGGSSSIGTWNTGAVTNMSSMFQSATVFNQNIGAWNTALVNTMASMFSGAAAFNSSITFNTAAVTNMGSMFSGAIAFNQPLSFNTALVTSMSFMFNSATAFNQPLSFNTGAVTSMASMFNNATAFNQNLGALNVANVTNFTNFMSTKTPATFSTTNLDAIYNGWVTVQSSRTISFGTAKYSAAGVAGRAFLTGTKLWTITDGGL